APLALHSFPTRRSSDLSLLLPLLAFAPIQVGWAQDNTVATGTISGVVQDQTTGAPLSGAQVRVVGTRLSTEAAPDGRYTLDGVRSEEHTSELQSRFDLV